MFPSMEGRRGGLLNELYLFADFSYFNLIKLISYKKSYSR